MHDNKVGHANLEVRLELNETQTNHWTTESVAEMLLVTSSVERSSLQQLLQHH